MCAVGGAVMMITPDGGVKKYVSLAVSLSFCAVFLSFLPSIGEVGTVLKLPEVTVNDTSETLRGQIIQKTVDGICNTVCADVMKKYSLTQDEITVKLEWRNGDEVEIDKIYIEIYGFGNMAKTTRIQYYVTDTYGIRCETVFVER